MASDAKRVDAPSADAAVGWNELGFLPRQSFQRMAPSILRLEITRLGALIADAKSLDLRNALVKTRYELEQFVESVTKWRGGPEGLATTHLETAILNLPVDYGGLDPKTEAALAYILVRLQYVHNRIRFVYQ